MVPPDSGHHNNGIVRKFESVKMRAAASANRTVNTEHSDLEWHDTQPFILNVYRNSALMTTHNATKQNIKENKEITNDFDKRIFS